MADAFANVFMARVEPEIISQRTIKQHVSKSYIDDWITN